MLTLTIFSVSTRCLGFIYKIYLTKIMTTTELGIYNLSFSIFMVLITIVGSSIPLTISKITSSNISKNKSYDTRYSVTSALIISTSTSIVICLMLILFKPILIPMIGNPIGYDLLLYLIPSVIFTALYSQVKGYLWGLENYFSVSIVEFVEQILRIVFCVVFILSDIVSSPLIAVGLSLSIACGLSSILGFYYYYKNGGKFKYKNGYYKEIISSTLPLTAVRLYGSLLQPITAFILPLQLTNIGMSQDLALSELGILMGMTMPLLSIPSTIIGVLCTILIPQISSEKDIIKINKQVNYYIKFTISCIFIFLPVFMTLGTAICDYVFKNQTAGMYMENSAWIMLPMGLAQITTTILNALNQEKKTFVYYFISSLFSIICVILLPYIIGVQALTFGIGISNIMLTIFNIIKIKKLIGYTSNILSVCFSHFLVLMPIILITKFIYNILISFCPILLSIFFTCILSVILFVALLITFNILDISAVKTIINKFKKKANKY